MKSKEMILEQTDYEIENYNLKKKIDQLEKELKVARELLDEALLLDRENKLFILQLEKQIKSHRECLNSVTITTGLSLFAHDSIKEELSKTWEHEE